MEVDGHSMFDSTTQYNRMGLDCQSLSLEGCANVEAGSATVQLQCCCIVHATDEYPRLAVVGTACPECNGHPTVVMRASLLCSLLAEVPSQSDSLASEQVRHLFDDGEDDPSRQLGKVDERRSVT